MRHRLWLLLLPLAGLGCERVALVKKCRGLAERVNPELESIALAVEKKRDAATYRDVAKRYSTLAKELEAFDAGAPEVDRAVAEYATSLRSSSRHVGVLAQAADAGTPQSSALVTRELEQEAKRQKNAAKRFRQECQSP
jgi:hypothetical protein